MIRSAAMMKYLLLLVVSMSGIAHADEPLPTWITVPAKPAQAIVVENYGQTGFKVKGGDDGTDVVFAGKHWTIEFDTSTFTGDERQKWTTLVKSLEKGGWKLELSRQEWNPPYASMKLVKSGKESWLFMWVGDQTKVEVVEKGAPPSKIALAAPTEGAAKVTDRDDFPFLKHFPGARLDNTTHEGGPLYVVLEAGKEPTLVASGTIIKNYALPPHTSGFEEEVVYQAALRAAGWTIVEVGDAVNLSDPNLTAHYAKGAIDLWVHVHAGGVLQLADVGAEHASPKLKAALDKTCKVAIYGVNFDFDKSTLRADATSALDSILKLLNDYKELKVELGGHTDNAGERSYNQKLSESRVAAVKMWLTKKGIAADRLTTKGYADTQPLVPNNDPQSMAKNRRVELKKLDCTK
jgi:OOP family OmpA-OmpF porin